MIIHGIAEISYFLSPRIRSVTKVAGPMGSSMMNPPIALRTFLQQRKIYILHLVILYTELVWGLIDVKT